MPKLLIFIALTFVVVSPSFSKQIHINFKDLTISQLIEVTSKTINKNILSTQPIEGKVNFTSSKEISEDELITILSLTLAGKGFILEEHHSMYTIVKDTKNKSKLIALEHMEVTEVFEILKALAFDKSVKISPVKESNSLLLMGSQRDIQHITQLIQQVDVSKGQVYVKAKIIEVNNALINNIGIRYGIFSAHSTSSELYTFSSNLNGLNSTPYFGNDIGLSLSSVNSILALGASINLLKQNHALNVISEPSILCLNNKESSIYVGEKRSIKTATTTTDGGTSKDTFERENIGLILKVKPRISNNSKVQLELTTILENFSQTNVTNNQPDTFKKEIITTAIVNNGESVIIGGLIEDKSEKVNNDVPFFSKIPLLGNLFKDKNRVNIKNNLVIIITPYIVLQNQNLTVLRDKLAKLQMLEDSYLQKSLQVLKKEDKTVVKKELNSDSLHEKRMKQYFGI